MEEAKIIENDLALIEIDTGEVTSLILGMDAEIRNCSDIVAELQGSIEKLPAMQTEDVKRIATDINGHLKHADEARKRFKREWKKPQEKVETAFKQAMEPMTELVNAYKGEAAKRDQETRQERYELMCDFYKTGAPVLAELVPIERFGVLRDKMSIAKGWSLVKAQEQLHEQLVQALNDWAALKTSKLAFEKEAEAEFFRTLSLQAALNLNAMREEEQARIDQLNAEMGIAPEPEPEPEPEPQQAEPEPQPEQVPQPEPMQQHQAPAQEEPRRYTITCAMTEWQKQQVIGFLKSMNISGSIREVRNEQPAI